jgi:Rrf2 family protein
MKLSMKTDYALRVLFTLVEHLGQGSISIRELAEQNEVPKPFLEHIMLELKARGWVNSSAGKRGGYLLAREPQAITMGEVVRHFDGILAPIDCVSVTQYERCTQEPVCRFRRILLEIRNRTARLMDATTLADLAAGEPLVGPKPLDQGFLAGDGI